MWVGYQPLARIRGRVAPGIQRRIGSGGSGGRIGSILPGAGRSRGVPRTSDVQAYFAHAGEQVATSPADAVRGGLQGAVGRQTPLTAYTSSSALSWVDEVM
jgi:hypothetical protein